MEGRTYPRLWHEPEDERVSEQTTTKRIILDECLSDMTNRFTLNQPRPKSLFFILRNSLVVGQEFILACLLLEWHRIELKLEDETHMSKTDISKEERKQMVSLVMVLLALLTTICFGNLGRGSKRIQKQRKRDKLRIRMTDALLLAGILRLLSAVLRTLTASYSSDTVHALAVGGMAVHLFTCDYSYANGRVSYPAKRPSSRRPVFQGGTLSLNAALFSTILLASRLSSNSMVYIFISSSITLFAFYPETRHTIAAQPHSFLASFLITAFLSLASLALLASVAEQVAFVATIVFICIVAPVWKYWLQSSKRIIAGPWDIAHVSIQNQELQAEMHDSDKKKQ